LFKLIANDLTRKEGGASSTGSTIWTATVCDYSDDRKTVVIERKSCITRITANPDGTLNIENIPQAV